MRNFLSMVMAIAALVCVGEDAQRGLLPQPFPILKEPQEINNPNKSLNFKILPSEDNQITKVFDNLTTALSMAAFLIGNQFIDKKQHKEKVLSFEDFTTQKYYLNWNGRESH